jgi:hypothetical protein
LEFPYFALLVNEDGVVKLFFAQQGKRALCSARCPGERASLGWLLSPQGPVRRRTFSPD